MLNWYEEEHKAKNGKTYLFSWTYSCGVVDASITWKEGKYKADSLFFGFTTEINACSIEQAKMRVEEKMKDCASEVIKSLRDFI